MDVGATIRKISTGIRNPKLISNYFRSKVIYWPYTYFHRKVLGREGIRVMDQDWDNLIILDACRFDIFEQKSTMPGELSEVISRGSATGEFRRENFPDTYHDTVYVTGNPVDRNLRDEQFHSIVHPWKTHWNEEKGTVLPSDMAAVTKEAHDEYPNKRIISHFIQPHQPFIGKKGQALYDKYDYGSTIPWHRRKALGIDTELDSKNIFLGLFGGKIDRESIWEAYSENLEVTMPHVEELVDHFQGKTVVSSDHGNIFKQPPILPRKPPSAHPDGIYLDKLVRIPWLCIDSVDRKDIIAETPPENVRDSNPDNVSKRLRQLGYITE